MFETILVPLDGSKLSEIVLPYAQELAGALGSEVVLVSVCEPAEDQYCHIQQVYMERMAEFVKERLKESAMVEVKKVKSVVLRGKPAEEIVNYAERNNISLIIMASHGRSGIMRWIMGSIANKVIQRTSTPILLIRASSAQPEVDREGLFSRILISLDGSEAGETPLPYISQLTNKLKADVILLQVICPGQHVHTIGGLDYILFAEQHVEEMKAEAKQYLERAREKLRGAKAIISTEVKIGDPAQEIIRLIDEANIGLVVISSHGCSGAGQWTFGSVAQKILNINNTPILIFRAPQTKA